MRILRSLALVAFLVPATAIAAILTADDSVAGLGTDITVSELSAKSAVDVVITPPLGPEIVAPVRTDSAGMAHLRLPGKETEVAGTYGITVEQAGMLLGVSTSFEVLPGRMSAQRSTIQANTASIAANGSDTVTIVVLLRDQYDNPLSGHPVTLISNRNEDRISALSSETDGRGEQRFQMTTNVPGTATIRAIDLVSGAALSAQAVVQAGNTLAIGGPLYGSAPNRQFYGSNDTGSYGRQLYGQVANFGLVDHFEIVAPQTLRMNEDATIRIVAVDRAGNTVEDYTGLVLLSSTDPSAYLPLGGEVQFQPQNLGEKVLTLGLRFRTVDVHILHAEDSQNAQVFGEATITVQGPGGELTGNRRIKIKSPKNGDLVSTRTVTVEGTTEPFVNLIVTGGQSEVQGESSIDGTFRIDVDLAANELEHTLRVTDEFGQLDSGDFTITLDTDTPVIQSVSFLPEEPEEGEKVTLVIETEPDLEEVTAEIGGLTLTLEEKVGMVGTYQTLFTAPSGDDYAALITATDAAGNAAVQTTTLKVRLPGLPKVQNVRATPEANAVTLVWDPVTEEPVGAYRIYVGETPTEFDFSLDTSQPTTAAQVAGLRSGTQYYFAVTAILGKRESTEKSDVASATVLGTQLSITEEDASLRLDWAALQVNTPLSSFLLDYGVTPDAYTEQRILNGELRTFTLRDLINGVTYYLRLTPVTVTGQPMTELAATAEGTPHGASAGFQPTPTDVVPFDVPLHGAASPGFYDSTPATPSTGVATTMGWVAAALAAVTLLFYWNRKRKLQATVAFLQAMEMQYHQ